jgi:hypothetical protein
MSIAADSARVVALVNALVQAGDCFGVEDDGAHIDVR